MNRNGSSFATHALETSELDLVHRYWPKAFISERFILDSKDAYPLPWMIREIVQNFLDHGKKLSLDDVTLEVRGTQVKQIIITGAWRFPNRGPVLALHGTKGREDAGANAIGLKQVLIRCCRDFGVSRFSIEGDGWDVHYHLAPAAEINARLTADGSGQVQYGWLVPEEVGASRRPHYCRYVIETANPELVSAFANFFDLGVHSKNRFLVPPSFISELGSLKWLPTRAPGRIFVKGQVMNFRRRGEGTNFWQGPEGVSLALPRAEYRKSIDRPAISEFELALLATPLIRSMDKETLIEQLKASAHLWSQRKHWAGQADEKFPGSTFGFLIVVRKMIDELQGSPLKKVRREDYRAHFADRKYVCQDQKADDGQAQELEERGFRVCPGFFERIGMARASDQFDAIANAKRHRPDPAEAAKNLDRLARDTGIPVGFDAVNLNSSDDFLTLINNRLQSFVKTVNHADGRVLRLTLNEEIPKELLSHPLYSANSRPQQLLFGCRTVIAAALRAKICDSAFVAQRTQGSTFALGHDEAVGQDLLISATVDIEQSQGTFLDLEFAGDQFEYFRNQLLPKYRSQSCAAPDLPSTCTAEPEDASEFAPANHTPVRPRTNADGPPRNRSARGVQSSLRVALVAVAIAIVGMTWLLIVGSGSSQPAPNGISTTTLHSESDMDGSASPQELEAAIEQLGQVIQSSYRSSPTDGSSVTAQPDPEAGYSFPDTSQQDGKAVSQIAAERNQARIRPINLESDHRARQLLAIQDVLSNAMDQVAADLVRDFAIVAAPAPGDLGKLENLRDYVRLTTGAAIPNALFVYTGTGSKGINVDGVGIGIHQAVLAAPFSEAVGTFVHEVAHNDAGDHGVRFERTLQALFTAMNDTLTQIARKADTGTVLTAQERAILDNAESWQL